ncbi:MAG TPA: peptide chain release factor 1 [Thermoflexia bacterium]|jgi:peptide chain release factor 1|nr:peptide chain release factor 1 [Thermoflexia bacterium]
MWERLQEIERRYEELGRLLADPAVASDPARLTELAREHSSLEELVTLYREHRNLQQELEETRSLLDEGDPELRELAETEVSRLEEQLEDLERRLRLLLLPKDPRDERDVIMEIRAGAGGDEAGLFAADLYRMYTRYAERQGWKTELLSAHPTGIGGFKEVIFEVRGKGAFSRLKFESGVHRVQRVPVTESSGRIHTSTATVAVLPEAEEVEIHIDPKELEIEVYGASGPGGQHMQKNATAVRITHKPTGIVVACESERSQTQNKARAMAILRARLYEIERRKQEEEIAQTRRSQVGTGERSEKIRTYNFPQNRVTDHRIGLTIYRLPDVLDGDLDLLIEELIAHEQEERLKEIAEREPEAT